VSGAILIVWTNVSSTQVVALHSCRSLGQARRKKEPLRNAMAGKALETVKNAISKLGLKAPWKVPSPFFARTQILGHSNI